MNHAIRVIPDGSRIRPSLYLTFTNGWVLALDAPFADPSFPTEGFPSVAFGSVYIGEGNHVFEATSYRTIQRNLGDLAELEATIREVASRPYINRDDLIPAYIDADPYHPGIADAIITDSGVHVWALIGAILLTGASPDEVAQGYEVPREAVDAAIAYYRRYRPVIIARIAANDVGAA